MNYTECLKALTDLGHELRGVKFDLAAIQTILASLGNPHRAYPTAIVAGTNGKGSTSAMLAGILQHSGYRTGLYTSPHLVRANERIRVNAAEVSDGDFARAFSEVWQKVDSLLRQKQLAQRPSFFEFLTATAFLHFARCGVEIAVLEVGMGGRLDATNVTEPRVAVITNVELDHQAFLGNTHAEIAWEKAGVIKPHRPVVSSCENPEAAEVIRRRAAELAAPLIETGEFAGLYGVREIEGRYVFDLKLGSENFPGIVLPLAGEFQIRNAVAAMVAAWQLRRDGFEIPRAAMVEGVQTAVWPGRLEVVSEHPLVVLDGAHNPAAARAIAAHVSTHWRGRILRLVYASMRDKSIGEISDILFPLADELILTQPAQVRAATPAEILAAARCHPPRVLMEPDAGRALELACRESDPEDVVLAAGSLFLVGEIKRALQENRLELEGCDRREVALRLP